MPVGAEWNACWKRRRACSSARTRSSRSVTSRRRTITPPSVWRGPVDGRLDERRRRAVGVRAAGTSTGAAGRSARPLASQASRSVPPRRRRRARRTAARRASVIGQPGQLGRLGVGAAHDAVVVERQHRLGQVVEQQPQLGLGVDEPLDRAVEVAGDAPRLEPRHDDGGDGEHGGDDGGGDGAGRAVARRGAARATTSATSSAAATTTDTHPAPHRRPPPDRHAVGDVGRSPAHAPTPGRRRRSSPIRPSGPARRGRLSGQRTPARSSTTRRGARSPRPRRAGPRRGGSRAGTPAPRRPTGPGGMPRCSITCVAVELGPDRRQLLLRRPARRCAPRARPSAATAAAALRSLRVVQSQRVSTLSSSSRSPASRT